MKNFYEKKLLATFTLLFILIGSVFAQQRTISGTVTAESDGMPLPGVTVVVQGSPGIGTVTNADGEYSLRVPDDADALVFSFVGMETQTIDIGTSNLVDAVLKTSTEALEEVVVVGYGTQKKVNITGSVDVITSEKIENRSAPNMSFLLQGTSPNLNIEIQSMRGGEPGAGGNWNIRGLGSISGNDTPLILVDGVEMSIDRINPENIESISVLKDASASAIYGSRAPFGVILITTKRGKKGMGARVQYNNNLMVKHPMKRPSYVDSYTWATVFNQAAVNAGQNPMYNEAQMERIKAYMEGDYPYEYDPDNPPNNIWTGRHTGNANYNWPREMTKDFIFNHKHELSLSGGDQKTQYYVSGGMLDEDGMYRYGYDFYRRYNILANVSSEVTDWLRIDFSSKYALTKTDYPQGQTNQPRQRSLGFIMPPYTPKYNINGTYYYPYINLLKYSGRDKTETNDLWVTLGGELEPVTGWKTKVTYNHNKTASRFTSNPKPVWVETGTGELGNIGRAYTSFETRFSNSTYTLVNAVSSYEKNIGNHFIKALVGYEQEEKVYANLGAEKEDLITPEIPSISTALGALNTDDQIYHWATQGIFGRLNYNFKEKYLLEFSARYNGSSRFAPGKRWGFFPSASAGYNISKENFWEPVEPYVNRLKIRGSYGSLGNQNVSNYLYLSRIPINTELPWIIGNELPVYAGVPGLISDDLTWETITTLDIGIDAGFLNNRLDLVFDWYERKTTDMIGPSVTLPSPLGTSAPRRNNAELMTKGFEIVLHWKDKISSDFSYDVQVSVGDHKTTILKYVNEKNLINDWYEGKVVGEIWGLTTDGIIQTEAEVETMPDQSKYFSIWRPGDIKYVDLTGDGKIDEGQRTVEDHGDLSIIGNSSPRYNIGITGGFNWKRFDFRMFWQGIGKRDFYFPRDWRESAFWGLITNYGSSGVYENSKHLDYWRPADETNFLGPNTDAYFPKPYFAWGETMKNSQTQTRYLQNAAYLRLKNLQIGYTLPPRISNMLFMERARIFFSGENLLTFHHLPKNLDPEASIASTPNEGGYRGAGVIYPLSTMLSIGFNLTF
jgi:TonB-linked SusC/RagA family outer membrane protein